MTELAKDEVSVRVTYEFTKNIKTLKKRYPNIKADVESVINEIRQGSFLGDRVAHTGYIVFKARIKNRDIKKGKSAGYRLIYQLESQDSALLLKIYAKSDVSDISATEIKAIIAEDTE